MLAQVFVFYWRILVKSEGKRFCRGGWCSSREWEKWRDREKNAIFFSFFFSFFLYFFFFVFLFFFLCFLFFVFFFLYFFFGFCFFLFFYFFFFFIVFFCLFVFFFCFFLCFCVFFFASYKPWEGQQERKKKITNTRKNGGKIKKKMGSR